MCVLDLFFLKEFYPLNRTQDAAECWTWLLLCFLHNSLKFSQQYSKVTYMARVCPLLKPHQSASERSLAAQLVHERAWNSYIVICTKKPWVLEEFFESPAGGKMQPKPFGSTVLLTYFIFREYQFEVQAVAVKLNKTWKKVNKRVHLCSLVYWNKFFITIARSYACNWLFSFQTKTQLLFLGKTKQHGRLFSPAYRFLNGPSTFARLVQKEAGEKEKYFASRKCSKQEICTNSKMLRWTPNWLCFSCGSFHFASLQDVSWQTWILRSSSSLSRREDRNFILSALEASQDGAEMELQCNIKRDHSLGSFVFF